jgi:protease IV
MTPQPPPGQGPIDPRGAFAPPPPPGNPQMQTMGAPGMMPPGGFMPPPMGFGPPGGFQPPGAFPPPGGFPGNYPPPGWLPPQKPRGGLGRALITTFATTIFGISLILNVYLFMLSGIAGDHASKSSTVVEGDPKQVVAIVSVDSEIMQKQADEFDDLMKQVEKDSNVKALVLRIDTPGGGVSPSDEMYHRVLQFKTAHPAIPVVVSMGGLATSGGYYISCGADWLVAEPQTWTANIGVLNESVNFSKLLDKWGIEDDSMHSTGADYKLSGSPLRPQTDDDKAYFMTLLDSAADQFHTVVTTGRGTRIKAPLKEVFNAKAYTAKQALDMGLVDQIGYQDDACKYAASKAGLTSMTVVKFEEPTGLLKLLQGRSNLPNAQAGGSVKINGVEIDSPQLDRLLNPRPMYLWRPN